MLKNTANFNSAGHAKNNHKQRVLLDLITARFCSAHSKDSLITVGTTSLDQHKLYYCSCEISDDVMVLIWNFPRDMYGHERYERYDNINNRLHSLLLKSND